MYLIGKLILQLFKMVNIVWGRGFQKGQKGGGGDSQNGSGGGRYTGMEFHKVLIF